LKPPSSSSSSLCGSSSMCDSAFNSTHTHKKGEKTPVCTDMSTLFLGPIYAPPIFPYPFELCP
jgi:hypothetical protein